MQGRGEHRAEQQANDLQAQDTSHDGEEPQASATPTPVQSEANDGGAAVTVSVNVLERIAQHLDDMKLDRRAAQVEEFLSQRHARWRDQEVRRAAEEERQKCLEAVRQRHEGMLEYTRRAAKICKLFERSHVVLPTDPRVTEDLVWQGLEAIRAQLISGMAVAPEMWRSMLCGLTVAADAAELRPKGDIGQLVCPLSVVKTKDQHGVWSKEANGPWKFVFVGSGAEPWIQAIDVSTDLAGASSPLIIHNRIAVIEWAEGWMDARAAQLLAAPAAGATAAAQRTVRQPDQSAFCHADDFTWVIWCGQHFKFTKGNQSECVRLLWAAWEQSGRRDGCGMSEKTLGELAGSSSDNFRIAPCFRKNPALGTMIRSSGRGSFGLFRLESQNNHSS